MDTLKDLFAMVSSQNECGRKFLTFVVYMTTLLDNILLTVIVPILPDYLSQIDRESFEQLQENVKYKNRYLHYMSTMFGKNSPVENATLSDNFHFDVVQDKLWNDNELNEENGAVGILLATKALMQLLSTPIVKTLSNSLGYRIPTVLGTFVLLLASLLFAIGQGYFWLLLARAMQGFASACISVCGMSIIAQIYPEEKTRSQVIGIILGSMALGVLLGYPFGGILYAFNGKSAPFFIIAILTFIVLVLQLTYMDLHRSKSEYIIKDTNSLYYLADPLIAKICAAILISTIAMATLEPCLPIWLMATLKPEKWQIGTVFIPDSIGYFASTNFLAILAHQAGGMPTAIVSLTVVGISCLLIPHASSIASLVLPHFALGMGIGTLDVALVPLLASIVDSKYIYDDEAASTSSYGSPYGGIYAVQQISVSLAYFFGPLLGGEISQYIGFSWLMSIIGLANICYGIYLIRTVLWINHPEGYIDKEMPEANNKFFMRLWPSSTTLSSNSSYKRFYDTMDKPQH